MKAWLNYHPIPHGNLPMARLYHNTIMALRALGARMSGELLS